MPRSPPNWRSGHPARKPDKIAKKQRKTLARYDLLRAKSVGIIEEDKKFGT
jgi:hypothetical protein